MFLFWSLIIWGTVYACVLAWSAITIGVVTTWRQALSGRDTLGGVTNLSLAACAMPAWSLVGFVAWRSRRRR